MISFEEASDSSCSFKSFRIQDSTVTIRHLSDVRAVSAWLKDKSVLDLCSDSRAVRHGKQMAFVAWPGSAQDGRQHVPTALNAGAIACLVEEKGLEQALTNWPEHLNWKSVACVPDLKATTGDIAADFYQHPSHVLSVVAITGTNGKTSSAWWLAQALTAIGLPCGVMGTLGLGKPQKVKNSVNWNDMVWESTGLTTPDPITIQRTLRHWADEGIKACAIEASSIGIEEHRLNGLRLHIALFTNFTQDHLDYHHNMLAYWQAKRRLFDTVDLAAAVIHIDDVHGQQLATELAQHRPALHLSTYGIQSVAAQLRVIHWTPTPRGLHFTVQENDGSPTLGVNVPFVGEYNIYNLLGVISALRVLGASLPLALQACETLTSVPGRMQVVPHPSTDVSAPLVLIDYAHTPDALEKALTALRPMTRLRQGHLHVVIGCGGNRDPLKRPLMAKASEHYADVVWLTSDNPRREHPHDILRQMIEGLDTPNRVHVIPDRAEAIRSAISNAAVADVVLIAGKGHETTQDINGIKHPFSDVIHAQRVLSQYPSP